MLEGEGFTTLSNCKTAFNSNLRMTEFGVAVKLHAHITEGITGTRNKLITKTLIPGIDGQCTNWQFVSDDDCSSTSRHSGVDGFRANVIS
jgi:hypothetical protein